MSGTMEQVAAQSSGMALRLRGVRRVFDPDVVAVDGVDLEVPAGQFLAILGPSGCGKSTLLRLVAGLDRADGGEVKLDGTRVGHEIAYVFQDAHLLPWRNVLHNVDLPLELMGVGRDARDAAARKAIEQVGLADAIQRYPAELSGGMRMRVSLARAIVTDPKILLLDEPFAALDEITRHRLDEQLRALWQRRGMTVLFVTHSTAEAVFLAERAVVLSARPARVVGDYAIDLPTQRTAMLRGEAIFAEHTRVLYEALRKGGA
jgi:NitT/TauT family transport system ATP-binding protein